MNAAFLLTVLVAAIIASGANVVGAEDTVNPEPRNRILRGNPGNQNDEERVGVPGAAWYVTHVMNKPKLSTQTSQQILHAAQNNEPLPKWAKAIIVLAGLGVVSGVTVAGVKISQAMTSTDNGDK